MFLLQKFTCSHSLSPSSVTGALFLFHLLSYLFILFIYSLPVFVFVFSPEETLLLWRQPALSANAMQAGGQEGLLIPQTVLCQSFTVCCCRCHCCFCCESAGAVWIAVWHKVTVSVCSLHVRELQFRFTLLLLGFQCTTKHASNTVHKQCFCVPV